MTAFFTFARPNSTIVYTTPLYGGTTGLIHTFLEPFGVRGIPVRSGDTAAIDEAIRSAQNCCIVYLETPANPTLIMTDIERAAATALEAPRPAGHHGRQHLPRTGLPAPASARRRYLLYSATKYLSGFSDMVAGVAITKDREMIQRLRSRRGMFGNILQPDECWMLDGRLPTVNLRMNRQSKNAQRIAEALVGHRHLNKVIYPTLFDDPEQKRIYAKQCAYPGGLFSLDFKGGKAAAFEFLRRLRIAKNAVSLGGVETLTCHPKSTTHSGMTPDELAESGVTDGLVRVSVGIEDWRDLLADFEQALAAIG